MKKKIVLDYPFGCTTASLFRAISTAEGLSDWFADKVDISGNLYTFYWNKIPHIAIMIAKKENHLIKFYWADDTTNVFEFKIVQNELIATNSLIITDFIDSDDTESAINLWDNQVEKLKRAIGCAKN